MSLEETRGVAHLGGIPAEDRERILVGVIMALKAIVYDKHVIAALKDGDALYGYQERSDRLAQISTICESRCKALTVEERNMWSGACELEYTKMLWDMLSDIQKFSILCDFGHPSACAFFMEYISLRLFHSQQMVGQVYKKFGVVASNE